MRVLVTGANGFIGRALCEKMRDEGWRVRGSVRSPGGVALPDGVETAVSGDVGPDTDWTGILPGVDAVIHLAAWVHRARRRRSDAPGSCRRVNVHGTERLARAASAAGVGRFVFVSSVKVHGEGGPVPYGEEDIPAPVDPYGASKWEAERVLGAISRRTGLETVVLRPPLVYGPRVGGNFLRLLKAVARGIPLPLAGVDNRRSLVYLGNLIDAIAACASRRESAGRMYLVSDGEDVSVPELTRRVAAALGRPARLFRLPPAMMRLADGLPGVSGTIDRLVGSLTVDSRRIVDHLGWMPPFTMAQGLGETAAWYGGIFRGSGRWIP